MGRISGRILGFFGFSGFLVDSGLMSSGLVLGTRPVFLKAAMIVQELHPGSIFVFFLSNLWAVFCCVFIVFCFLFDFAVFGSFGVFFSWLNIYIYIYIYIYIFAWLRCVLGCSGACLELSGGPDWCHFLTIHAHIVGIFGFGTTISACFRAVTMVDALPRAFRYFVKMIIQNAYRASNINPRPAANRRKSRPRFVLL